jgi:LytS/YehU family sensor histidine kinase
MKMIEDYIELKKLEIKDNIEIRFQTGDQTGDPAITPGLLLPLLEITVERPDDMPGKTQVAVELRTSGGAVYFSLSNNMPGKKIEEESSVKTTLDSVRKRLQSCPDQKFKLEVYPAIDSFTIVLQVATQVTADKKDLRGVSQKTEKS